MGSEMCIRDRCDLVISEHIDICAVTETWLTGIDCFTITDLINTLQDYNVYSLPRSTRGGGVAVITRKGLQVKRNTSSVFSSFETLDLAITSGNKQNKQFRLLTIYRPRATKKNNLSKPQFFPTSRNFWKNSSLHPTSSFWLTISIFM